MKIKITALLLMALTPIAASSGEWALINSSGTVVQVIVADAVNALNRDNGPWVKCYTKVGKGWHYDGLHFSAPVSTRTFTP